MHPVITLSGRKRSGKGVLSDLLTQNGAHQISMAGWLKKAAARLFSISEDNLNLLKNEGGDLPPIDPVQVDALCTAEPGLSPFKTVMLERNPWNARHFLQFFGTEICRASDPEFHTKKAFGEIERLRAMGPVVSDDVRFPNELVLRQKGAHCFFIISPWNWDVSNHPSETSILWADFDRSHIIVNDQPLSAFQWRYRQFFQRLLSHGSPWEHPIARRISELAQEGLSSTDIARRLKCSRDKVIWWAIRANLRFRHTRYESLDAAMLEPTAETAYWAGLLMADGCVKRSGNSNTRYVVELTSIDKELVEGWKKFTGSGRPIYTKAASQHPFGDRMYQCQAIHGLIIENPFILENLKLWGLKPRKSLDEDMPYMVQQHPDLLGPWLRGLIDGDGSVFQTTQYGKPQRHVVVLTSHKLSAWLQETLRIPCSIEPDHKGVPGLTSMRFAGKNAERLGNLVSGFPRLERKWGPHFENL